MPSHPHVHLPGSRWAPLLSHGHPRLTPPSTQPKGVSVRLDFVPSPRPLLPLIRGVRDGDWELKRL